jgi:membrane-bound ClpP family serine protease
MDGLTILGMMLLIAGFILVGIEMVLPGFSVPGISGIICLVAGVFLLADTFVEGVFITVVVLAILGIIMAVVLWFFSKGKMKSPLILKEEQKRTNGYLSSSDLNYLLGRQGIAMTDLRPAGVVKIDGINFDVITGGDYISKGSSIEIIKVEGAKLIVKNMED